MEVKKKPKKKTKQRNQEDISGRPSRECRHLWRRWESSEALELILWQAFLFVSPRWLPFVFVWREATDEPREETRTETLEEKPAEDAAALLKQERSPCRALSLHWRIRTIPLPVTPKAVCLLFIYLRSASPHPPSSPSIS